MPDTDTNKIESAKLNEGTLQSGQSQQLDTMYQKQSFFDYKSVLNSETAKVAKQWYLHPYTGVGPHSVSFSQSLTNRDIINMYTQSGNYFYHSNCYSASYWTASSGYHQWTVDPKKEDKIIFVREGESDEEEGVRSAYSDESLASSSVVDDMRMQALESHSELLNISPSVRIYYRDTASIPKNVWDSLSTGMRSVLQSNSKYRLTMGRRLVQPKEWRSMDVYQPSKWGRNSASKLGKIANTNLDPDLNKVDVFPPGKVKTPAEDFIVASGWQPLPDKTAYYWPTLVKSGDLPESFGIKTTSVSKFSSYQGHLDCADTVPVRSVTRSYSMLPSDIDVDRPLPTTNVYSQFMTKITKDMPDDAFRSMISRPAITDADVRIWLAHTLSKSKYGSYMDVVPQLTAMLMLYSLTKDRHFIDPIVFRTIRNKSVKAYDRGVVISRRDLDEYPSLYVVTSHLTYFVKYMARVVPTASEYDPNLLDMDWVAIPVTAELLANPTKLGAYVVSHMSSEYWNGTVTWYRKSAYQATDKQVPDNTYIRDRVVIGNEYFMPSSNSVYIAGVRKVWLVVMPSVADASPSLAMFGTNIPRSPGTNGKLVYRDIKESWQKYWEGSDTTSIPAKITDFFWALGIMMHSTTTPDSTRRALGLATELSNVSYPGVRLTTGGATVPLLMGGAWTYGGTKVFKNKYDSKDWADGELPVKNRDVDRRQRMAGFSYSSVSPSIQHAASYCELGQNLFLSRYYSNDGQEDGETWTVDKISQRWATVIPTSDTPQYVANQATSICRLAVAAGFLETGGGAEYSFTNSYAVQQFLTHNGSAMFGNMAAMMIDNDIQPWFWLGYGYNDYPQYFDAYSKLFKGLFHSTIYPKNIQNLDLVNPEYDWASALSYYNTNPFDSEVWMQSIPVPICNYLQWTMKLGIARSPNTDSVMPIRLMGEELYGLRITKRNNDLKARLFLMVNDSKTSWPKVRVFDAFEDKPYDESMWMDDYYFLSTALVDPGVPTTLGWDKSASLSSSTYARAVAPGVLGYEVETVMVITSGLGLSRNELQAEPHVTPVCLPDPPTAKSFLAEKIMVPPTQHIENPDPPPTREEVMAITDSVTPVTTTITQA
jgi:hypothetical protein